MATIFRWLFAGNSTDLRMSLRAASGVLYASVQLDKQVRKYRLLPNLKITADRRRMQPYISMQVPVFDVRQLQLICTGNELARSGQRYGKSIAELTVLQ